MQNPLRQASSLRRVNGGESHYFIWKKIPQKGSNWCETQARLRMVRGSSALLMDVTMPASFRSSREFVACGM